MNMNIANGSYLESLDSKFLPLQFRLSPKAFSVMILVEMVGCVSLENIRQVMSIHDQRSYNDGVSLSKSLIAGGLITRVADDVFCSAMYTVSTYSPQLVNCLTLALSYIDNVDDLRHVRRGDVGNNLRFTAVGKRFEIIPVNVNTLANITKTINEDVKDIERLRPYITNINPDDLTTHKLILLQNDKNLSYCEKKIKEMGLNVPHSIVIPNKDETTEQIGYSFLGVEE